MLTLENTIQGMKIHSRFNFLLDHYDWSQRDFADKAHVSDTTISKWCSGKATPRPEKIPFLAKVFNCNAVWLMTGHGDPFEDNSNEIRESQGKWSHISQEDYLDRIRKTIDKTGLSNRLLAEKFGVSHTTVNNWAKGKISKKHLQELCEQAGVDINWVKDGTQSSMKCEPKEDLSSVINPFLKELEGMTKEQAEETVKIAMSLIEIVKTRK